MQLKTFEALSMKDAIRAIKKELGPSAVIVSSKPKKAADGTISGIEVSAAAAVAQKQNHFIKNQSDILETNLKNVENKINHLSERLEKAINMLPSKTVFGTVDSGINYLKILMNDLVRNDDKIITNDTPREVINIYNQLKISEVDSFHLSQLVQYLSGISASNDENKKLHLNTEDFFRTHAMRWMLRRIKISPNQDLFDNDMRVNVFMGSSSAGKSSIVCKLAHHGKTKRNKKIRVLSLDNIKIGSNELLRIYCKILDIPFAEAHSPEDFLQATKDLTADEYLLVDTPSISTNESALLECFSNFNQGDHASHYHLVVSLSDKQINQDKIIAHFAPIGITSLIYTKADESGTCGELINMPAKWSIPISYLSIGKNIPEDLEIASRERIISKIFGL